MPLFIKDVVAKLENEVPLSLQENWDNSGYQVKLSDAPVTGILVSLDISPECITQAEERNLNLIITHHPLFFHPLRNIDISSEDGKLLADLIGGRKLCLYSMHTNFDSSKYSMSRYIADRLGAKNIVPLVPKKRKLYKLVVYIPKGYSKTVRDALFAYANPKIGNYENCSFETKGTGSFKPLEGSDPFSGTVNETFFADESKLEVLIEEKYVESAIKEMIKVHPYEEPAFDLYRLHDFGGSDSEGMGASGFLQEEPTFKCFLDRIESVFTPAFINYGGDLKKTIKKISVVSGSGFSFIEEAHKSGSDVFISSELSHDKAIKASRNGICFVEMSHFDTEKHFSGIVREILSNEFNVPIAENNFEINPFFHYKGGKN